jgi:hypothetical protein
VKSSENDDRCPMDRRSAARAAVATGVLAAVLTAGCGQRTRLRPVEGLPSQPHPDAATPVDAPGSDARDAGSAVDRVADIVRPGSACEDWPVPEGRFDFVSSGNGSSCAIRSDGTLACWGHLVYPRAAVPTGSFLRVSAYVCVCGVRESGRLACWGCDTAPPSGAIFQDVGRGAEAQCALRLDGTMACWGPLVRADSIPAYKYDTLSAGTFYTCGIEISARWAVCWDPRRGRDSLKLTKGPFGDVGAGRTFACGLLTDGTPQCWAFDDTSESPTPPPGITFRELSVGEYSACGVRDDGSAVCWGANHDGEATPPDGARLLHVSVGTTHSCGILVDGTLTCWGRFPDPCPSG